MCMIARNSKSIGACAVVALIGGAVWYFAAKDRDGIPGTPTAAAAVPTPDVPVVPKPSVLAANAEVPKEAASGRGKSDHIMFGGTPQRNMVNLIDTGISGNFKLDEAVKWKAQLGTKSYGGPTVVGGKILIGTNNENPRNKRDRNKPTDDDPVGPAIDKGIIMCFDEKTGEFLWQAVHDKLPSGQVHDYPREGICSTPIVDEGRAYYVSNRCTVVCAGMNGLDKNNNEGFQNEKYKEKADVDIIWEYDMMKELDVFPHNLAVCSPLIIGDLLFIVTANGVDENHANIPAPGAPSFIVLSKKSGRLIWKNGAPGKGIMHGQWSNPAYAVIKDVPQVIFPGGDGWLYSFKPDTGDLIWKFDANPKDAKYELGGKSTKSDFISTPVIYKDKIYIGTGQDPEHGDGVGHYWCFDPAGKTGDISPELVTDDSVSPPKTKPNPNSGLVWHYGGNENRKFAQRDYYFGRTMSTACVIDNILYIPDLAGYLHVLDAKTGKKFWQYDLKSAIWGSAYYVDGKIFLGNEDGDLFVFKHEKTPAVMDEVEEASKEADEKAAKKKLLEVRKAVDKRYKIAKIAVDEPIRSTPLVANGVLYIMTERTLFAIKK
jgi:outer membrane protein assembly factor BamB